MSAKLKCPFCGSLDTYNTETRDTGDRVRRRKECKNCGSRFTSYEVYIGEVPLYKRVKQEALNPNMFRKTKRKKRKEFSPGMLVGFIVKADGTEHHGTYDFNEKWAKRFFDENKNEYRLDQVSSWWEEEDDENY